MSTISLNVRYRPLRIGWCVRQGDLEDMVRSAQLTLGLEGYNDGDKREEQNDKTTHDVILKRWGVAQGEGCPV